MRHGDSDKLEVACPKKLVPIEWKVLYSNNLCLVRVVVAGILYRLSVVTSIFFFAVEALWLQWLFCEVL